MMILRSLLIVYLAMLVLVSGTAEPASLINVPLNPDLSDFNRETYRFIHRLLNKRVLPGIRRGSLPLTRKQVVSCLLEVDQKQKNGEIALSAIDQERLSTLLTFYREVRAPITQSSETGYRKCRRGFSGNTQAKIPRFRHPKSTQQTIAPDDDGGQRLSFLFRLESFTACYRSSCR